MAPFFSILVITYNRPQLLQSTLRSLAQQTFQDFEVYLLDNASAEPVEDIARNILGDHLVHYDRRQKNSRDGIELMEPIYDRLSGRYLLILADDDGLVPSALQRVYYVAEKYGSAVISTNLVYYVHPEVVPIGNQIYVPPATGCLYRYQPMKLLKSFLSVWGIGTLHDHYLTPDSHLSATFLSIDCISMLRKLKIPLMVRPLGDVGLLSMLIHGNSVEIIDQPLVLIGKASVRDLDGMKPGRRYYWKNIWPINPRAPLKALSFVNIAIESHLEVVFFNQQWLLDYSTELQPLYYFRHLREVIQDHPWTRQTFLDIGEWITVVVAMPPRKLFGMVKYLLTYFTRLLKKIFHPRRTKQDWISGSQAGFDDLASAAAWVESHFATPLSENIPALDGALYQRPENALQPHQVVYR
ncbi:MAG TPA: glycosyltransferase family 2 protein [Anaerolineaceae bacterium]